MFKKLGRPPEDRAQRRREIWAAVSPLIEKYGVRKLTMREAAAASFMSAGALYHYFPNKRALVLFGLDPQSIKVECEDFMARSESFKNISRAAAVEELVRLFCEITFFKRPAMQAAVELGTKESRSRLDIHINLPVEGLIEMLRVAMPDADDHDLRTVVRALRELSFATALDTTMTRAELERELRAIVRGVPAGQRRTGLAAAG